MKNGPSVVVLAYDGVQLLDVAAPVEVFTAATVLGEAEYRIQIASVDSSDAVTSSGVRIGTDLLLSEIGDPIDVLLVPGCHDWAAAIADPDLIEALCSVAGKSRRIAGVGSGTFLLGAAGLLDGCRATTHWSVLDELEQRFPKIEVERDAIFVDDGRVQSSAGVTAGVDLALALIEADHGPELTRLVARHLVVFMQRAGGQAQYSARMKAHPATRAPLREVLDAVAEHPEADHRLEALGELAGYSTRHLTRVFMRELGATPARYVERVRVEAACDLLESTDMTLGEVAQTTGLGSAETLRRSFARERGITPTAYRQRFRIAGIAPPETVPEGSA